MEKLIFESESYEHFAEDYACPSIKSYVLESNVKIFVYKSLGNDADKWSVIVDRQEMEPCCMRLYTEQLEFLLGKLNEFPECKIKQEIEIFDETSYVEVAQLPTDVVIQKIDLLKK